MISNLRMLPLALGMLVTPVMAQDGDETGPQSDPVNLNYVGDDVRIGIGYDSETDLTGEIFWSFGEKADSAWVAEGWLGDESSGGLKLNYHWLADGVEAGQDINGNTVFADGKKLQQIELAQHAARQMIRLDGAVVGSKKVRLVFSPWDGSETVAIAEIVLK